MIPFQILPSQALTEIALMLIAEARKVGSNETITLHRGHIIALAGSLTDAAEQVELLEQSDRTLDTVTRELQITRADVSRLEIQLQTSETNRRLASIAAIRADAAAKGQVIDLAEILRREQKVR